MIDKEHIEQKLKEQGYKLTNQRKAIIDVFLQHKGHFLSAEEIYLKSKEQYSQTNFSTIYRNLEILERLDIIHKTSVKEGTSSYGLESKDKHHHHIICKSCGKTDEIDFCPLAEIHDKLRGGSFTLTDHKFELYGYCDNCNERQ